MKLNSEKRTALAELMDSVFYPVLLELVDAIVRSDEIRLLTYDVKSGDEKGLLQLKCEVDGARKLANAIQREMKSIRLAALKA